MSHPHPGDTVQVHYTGRLDDGRVFASSRDRAPLEWTVGEGNVIPTLEEALVQMEPGEERTVIVPAEWAYGQYRPELVQSVDRSAFPSDVHSKIGHQVQVEQEDGKVRVMTIADVDDDQVIIDANHPLAGQNLTFELELVAITTAAPG